MFNVKFTSESEKDFDTNLDAYPHLCQMPEVTPECEGKFLAGVNGRWTPVDPPETGRKDAVAYNPQELTEVQKAQSRENIGAVCAADVESALKPVTDGFDKKISNTNTLVSNNTEAIRELVDVVSDIGDATDALKKSISDTTIVMGKSLDEISDEVETVDEKAESALQSTNTLGQTVREMGNTVDSHGESIKDINDRLDLMGQPDEEITKTLGEMSEEIDEVSATAADNASAIAEHGAAISENKASIESLEKSIADLLYKKIDITSFSHSKVEYEIGEVVTATTVSWKINKVPTKLYLDGAEIEIGGASGSKTIEGISVSSDRKWTLKATDERNATDTYDAWIRFYRGVYYGKSKDGDIIDNAFITALTKKLSGSKKFDFEITQANDEYAVIALPTSYGVPTITIDGWTYGWGKIAELEYTNGVNHTESYSVYRSEKGGGTSHVHVS
jgi:uncharacterized protein YoxC